ncbi:hypothetical protein GCM10027419_52680 [Pandoraea terrae]
MHMGPQGGHESGVERRRLVTADQCPRGILRGVDGVLQLCAHRLPFGGITRRALRQTRAGQLQCRQLCTEFVVQFTRESDPLGLAGGIDFLGDD